MVYRRRRGNVGRARRQRRQNARRNYKAGKYGKRFGVKIASRSHVFKRFAAECVISVDQNGYPTLLQNGGGDFALGSVGVGTLANTADFGLTYTPTLANAIESSDFTNLFDRYKILGVKLKIMYQANVGEQHQHPLPLMIHSFDGDDAAMPTTWNDVAVKGYAKEVVLNANLPLKTYFKPRISKMVFNGAISTAYTSSVPEWLDCDYDKLPHWGWKAWLKSFFTGSGSTTTNAITIQPIMYLAFKDTL